MKNWMKAMMVLSVVTVLGVGGAVLAGSMEKTHITYTAAGAAVSPFGYTSTLGIPLYNDKAQAAVSSVTVTVMDYNDGGNDDNAIWLCTGMAWRYSPTALGPDGGLGWSRDSALDVACSASLGLSRGHTMQKAITAKPAPGDRLYYTTTAMDDAGVFVPHRTRIEGAF